MSSYALCLSSTFQCRMALCIHVFVCFELLSFNFMILLETITMILTLRLKPFSLHQELLLVTFQIPLVSLYGLKGKM